MSLTTIRVSEADFNPGEEIERLIESSPEAGGVASFVGVVRNRNDGNDVTHLTLEHYPAMTERALADWLKTEAPFWKKERTPEGERWVDARESDEEARRRWGEAAR